MKILLLALMLLALPAGAADNLIKPGSTLSPGAGSHMFLQTADGHVVPAVACMATDGSSNLIPIPGGGGGGGAVTQGTVPWVTDGSATTQPISAVALPLPTGAATAAKQDTGNTSLASIATNTTGASTAAKQDTGNTSLSSIVTNTNAPANGSVSNNAAITTTASTFTAPANAVGFVLEAESGNTANIRWAVGATATASVGSLAEPGRDTGYIPGSANISVIAISGTQAASVQWVVK